jgi:hypothetical protein
VFIKEASGVVCFPGGFGTLDEAFEVLTLVQTGKADQMPIVFVDKPKGTFWKSMDEFIKKRLLGQKKISPEDVHLYKIATSAQEACEEILKFYSNYHSMRYIGDLLVLRVHHPVDKKMLEHLNKNFSDIVVSGKFTTGKPHEDEENQPELKALPRIFFKFNRVNNGRLRQLINYLNTR